MTTMPQDTQATEHARWESEHGHWLKDLRVWETKHQEIRDSVDGIIQALNKYDETVEQHSKAIQQHHEILKMHEDAMAWRREHHKRPTDDEAVSMHEIESEAHKSEKDAHATLKVLHDTVLQHAMTLVDRLRLSI